MAIILRYNNFGTLSLNEWVEINEASGDTEPKSWSNIINGLKEDFNLNWGFLVNFGTAISALMPVVNSLVKNMPTIDEVELSQESIGLITVCALSVVAGEAKATYKKLFEEMRLRGVYDYFKRLVPTFEFIKKLFTFITRSIGKVSLTIFDMFAYTSLLIPFLHSLLAIINTGGINLDTIDALSAGDAISLGVGFGTLTVKQLLKEVLRKMKLFKFRDRSPFKKAIDSIKTDISVMDDDELIDDVVVDGGDDIKKYDQFHDNELLQDDVNESRSSTLMFIRQYLEDEKITIDELNALDDETYNDYYFDIIDSMKLKIGGDINDKNLDYVNDEVENTLDYLSEN